jgi:uncharacterized membrane protein YfcA
VDLFILLGGLGMIAGFLSGLLGIGGGIIMAPLLLYVPPLCGLDPLPMRVVAGLTIVQGLVACIAGSLCHRKFHFVSGPLTRWMGTTIFLAAFLGGAGAGHVADAVLLGIFALLALVAAILTLLPAGTDCEDPDVNTLYFSKTRAVTTSGVVGLLGGLVGQGGSFILIPLMTAYVGIPTRIAIGSNLAIVLLSSLAAFVGKAITGQIAWAMALPIAITVVPAACLGSLTSRRMPVPGLRRLLALVIALAALRMGISVLLP